MDWNRETERMQREKYVDGYMNGWMNGTALYGRLIKQNCWRKSRNSWLYTTENAKKLR